ncbi:amino acid adenylation domain-containing protein [Nocardia tengchongensis]|uniref:amino acid adenylation domain-containing protein n=1 Tax=Nocardia tengchongensis TaxID=2055889 RepID=UPI00367814DB
MSSATAQSTDRRSRPEWYGSAFQAFSEVASAFPDRDAVLDEHAVLTYAELDQRCGILARILVDRGIGVGDRVAVFLPRTVDLAVAILGILRAGAVYVPFDPEQPAQRLARQARTAGTSIAVTAASQAATVGELVGDLVVLDSVDWTVLEPLPWVEVEPNASAYIIFTSGSTGTPKGVEVSHRALISFLNGMETAEFFSPPGTRVAWNASVAFDASVQEWVRLLRGDTVGILSDDARRDPYEFADFIRSMRLTEIDMTPSHAVVLMDDLAEVARTSHPLRLIVAGESIPPDLWRLLQELTAEGVVTAANLYGPTETAVNVLGAFILPEGEPSIGRPLAGVLTRVVDDRLQPVAAGATGELCIVGPYLAKGYLGQPGLTASKFAPDPLTTTGERMYRTGDRVTENPDGTFTYVGRTDTQVKIRGHRIELGEIETLIADHPAVLRAVVLYQSEGPSLTAVLRLAPDGDVEDVRAHVTREVPSWMQPTHYHVVDHVPLTVGGKADRQSLLAQLTARTAER